MNSNLTLSQRQAVSEPLAPNLHLLLPPSPPSAAIPPICPSHIAYIPERMASMRRTGMPPPAVAANPAPADRILSTRFSEQSLELPKKVRTASSAMKRMPSSTSTKSAEPKRDNTRTFSSAAHESPAPVINIATHPSTSTTTITSLNDPALADELDFVTVASHQPSSPNQAPSTHRTDKASRILGIRHRASMEPIPASARNSIMSTRSLRDVPAVVSHAYTPNLPLTSLYVVSGLPKSPHTWTLADPDSVMGLHHAEGAVNRWWRPEVLGSTVSPGAGGGKKKRRGKGEEVTKGAGALSKQEVGKMLSKALKVGIHTLNSRNS